MKKNLVYLWMLALTAFCVSADELPFTVVITPNTHANTVTFKVINNSFEPITGIAISRNNEGAFRSVHEQSGYTVYEPASSGNSDPAPSLIREVWRHSEIQAHTQPKEIMHVLKGAQASIPSNSDAWTRFETLRGKISNPDTRSTYSSVNSLENDGDDYVARVHGFLKARKTGRYWIQVEHDDGAYVTLLRNNSSMPIELVNSDNDQTDRAYVDLAADEVVYLEVYHVENYRSDYLRMYFASTENDVKDSKKRKPIEVNSANDLAVISPRKPDGTNFPALDWGAASSSSGASASTRVRIGGIEGLQTTDAELAFTVELPGGADLANLSENAAKGGLWNLAFGLAKTTIQVFGAYGNTSTITLGDTVQTDPGIDYIFVSDSRPLNLTVRCVGEDGALNSQAARYRVTITDPTKISNDVAIVIAEGNNLTNNTTKYVTVPFDFSGLRAGMQVVFEAAEESYFDVNGAFVYHTFTNAVSPDLIQKGVERFVATGLNVNGSPLTGDKTRYTFNIRENTIIDFRVRHEYAMDVKSDFSRTKSELMTATGDPWAGPLTSAAMGSPDPDAGADSTVRHWMTAGSQVVAKIDAEVQDMALCAQMLNVRYIPYEYVATGSARGDVDNSVTIVTNGWNEAKIAGTKHQVDFKINQFTSLTYHWKIQFGVYAQSTEPTLRMVQRYNSKTSAWIDIDPVGAVYWFDQGANVRVLSAARKDSGISKALSGWMLGDGYYFSSDGKVESDGNVPGLVITRDANNNPVAEWQSKVLTGNGMAREYHGLNINRLLRPVAVSWNYGKLVFKDSQLKLGEYMLQGRSRPIEEQYPAVGQRLFAEPSYFDPPDAAAWDPNAKVLFPIKPGALRVVYTNETEDTGFEVHVHASWPVEPHYRHIAGSPAVQLTPDTSGTFRFVSLPFSEKTTACIQNDSEFFATENGWALLRFKEVMQSGRGEPKEYIALRTVLTQGLMASVDSNRPAKTAIIGQAITDPLDLAGFGTGYLATPWNVPCNPSIYDSQQLESLSSAQLYDVAKLKALKAERIILHPELLPGPIIPVNEYPANTPENMKVIVTWYDDPVKKDGLLWPYSARRYDLRWPENPQEGLGRIVIASEWGSESLGADGFDQTVAFATNGVPVAKTFDPSRFTDLKVYSQPDPDAAGYNPNEEHALLAPSFRHSTVSPRPNAVYALRAGDLNNYGGVKTSKPYVLVQFFDSALSTYAMRVFNVVTEDKNIFGHYFAEQGMLVTNATGMSTASAVALQGQPHKTMEAGEPVIALYPLGVVEGAVPCPESTGVNLRGQTTFWKDHKNTRWSVSGGTNAWFSVKAFYPLQPDFWWPSGLSGATLMDGRVVFSQVGASVAFLPPDLTANKLLPTKILYKSDWPRIAPTLKAGETITYSGGEYRADHPTTVMSVPTPANPNAKETIQTPGLPAVTAFAVGEMVFDALNPQNETGKLLTDWTLRVAQVMGTLSVELPLAEYPAILQPANGKTRLYQGKYIFKDLPASLQKRVRYDPVAQRLELRGVLNDKTTDDSTLTASPAAVYTLEPNILTGTDIMDIEALGEGSVAWSLAVQNLFALSRNPTGLTVDSGNAKSYLVGLQPKVSRNEYGIAQGGLNGVGIYTTAVDVATAENMRAFGVGLAAIPNGKFLDPKSDYPDVSWVTLAENNDPSMGGSPVTLHVIKVDRRERYRGAIKVVLSDNVFDENVVLRHTGDFGANGDDLVYEWWYRPDDGALNVPPPYSVDAADAGDWKLFPDLSGREGRARNEVLLKGDPNAPEALLADSWWFVRYRHMNDTVRGMDWAVRQSDNAPGVNYTWAGAGNSDPFNDLDMNGLPDYKAQLSMGWIKRVLDAVNPYEARIADFTGDAPATGSSMLQQLGPRFEGPVALNPDKNVVENVGLIELYQTILKRASDLSINLSSPVSTPAIANALQLASTRLSDFYMLLGNEAYVDANDPTIGYGSASVEYGAAAPVVHAFQNQTASLLEEELVLLRGQDDGMARPVYNRMFWNFTKGEGEAAYAMNYNISDLNKDGFIDEDDAMILYPQGHGDAWGHYLTALKQQYNLLCNANFNWVSRSEFYNLMDIVMKVDYLDERKFAQVAAQKAKVGAEIVADTYRQYYTEDETAQWQGYTDVNVDRAWGVQDWARRAGQGAYFDWLTANALLPSEHPNTTLTGIQKVDRQENADIRVISANFTQIQATFDDANNGFNPLSVSSQSVPFDINPYMWDDGVFGRAHFEQIYDRAVAALNNAKAAWDNANAAQNRLRAIANTEQEFRNDVYQQDIAYKNQLVEIFGRPYPGTVGSGKFYPDGYSGPDITYYMYVAANKVNADSLPKPSTSLEALNAITEGSELLNSYDTYSYILAALDIPTLFDKSDTLERISTLFGSDSEMNTTVNSSYYDLSRYDLDATDSKLAEFGFSAPVTAATYSFLAPDEWGDRPAVGEVQAVIAEMLQTQISVAKTLDAYDNMLRKAGRTVELVSLKLETMGFVGTMGMAKQVIEVARTVAASAKDALMEGKETVITTTEETEDIVATSLPQNTPTAGVAVSLGDALAPVRGTVKTAATVTKTTLSIAGKVVKYVHLALDIAAQAAQAALDTLANKANKQYEMAEMLVSIDDILEEEKPLRLELMAQIETLRSLDDKYRTIINKGAKAMDEREAFNKRVAAMVQQNRYQDMTFRVERNHALQNYHHLLDIAARYTYLAAKAYDYETNFDTDAPGSPSALFAEIIKARTIGFVADGGPQIGQGLAGVLAHLNGNYQALKGQLGLTNPQVETGKLSLRSERFRIFPKDEMPEGDSSGWSGLPDANANWRMVLENARVADLWHVPEFRYLARPFGDSVDAASGAPIAEPGIVLRFSSCITSGKNFFGHPLAGGDHAYDPSVYAARIRSVGVWFSDYHATDVLNDLAASPRVYLIPTGADVMSIPNASSPTKTRVWNVVDQVIPVPFTGIESKLPYSNFVPLLDSLDGRIGQQRRFSSFRAYHDSESAVITDELVSDSRLVGRSVWNTGWTLIIPGRALNADPDEGLNRFIQQVSDIKLVFQTYGFSGN